MVQGRIVILNGVPRSGKSSIAAAMQERGPWLNLGVDHFMAMLPPSLHPGLGLRPGGERPDLEPVVVRQYQALYDSVAAHCRLGFDVVVDVAHHDSYSQPLDTLGIARSALSGFKVLWVGVHCPLDELMKRREATGWSFDEAAIGHVKNWISAVHDGKVYDLELETSLMSPDESAERILTAL